MTKWVTRHATTPETRSNIFQTMHVYLCKLTPAHHVSPCTMHAVMDEHDYEYIFETRLHVHFQALGV